MVVNTQVFFFAASQHPDQHAALCSPVQLCDLLQRTNRLQPRPHPTPTFGSHGNGFCSTPVHTHPSLPEGSMRADTECNRCHLRCLSISVCVAFCGESDGGLLRTSKLHLDRISRSRFLQLLCTGAEKRDRVQL